MSDGLMAMTDYQKGQLALGGVNSGVNALDNMLNASYSMITRAEDIKRADEILRKQWERDDSAIQRRIADANKAGVSPYAVLGSGAGNTGSSAVSYSPQLQQAKSLGLDRMLPDTATLGQIQAKTEEIESQTLLNGIMAKKVEALTEQIEKDSQLKDEQIKSMKMDNKIKQMETDIMASMPEAVAQKVIEELKAPKYENMLKNADSKLKYFQCFRTVVQSACDASKEVRTWVYDGIKLKLQALEALIPG